MTSKIFNYSPTVAINYEIHGKGRPIVLIHGFGASLETWRDIQPLLESSYSLYSLDLKGSGLSSKPHDGDYFPDTQAQIVASFIQFLNLEDVTLVGHSYGGAVALMTHLRLRTLPRSHVSRLVLIDSAAYPQKLPFFVSTVRMPVVGALINLSPARTRASYTLKRILFDRSKVTPERIERYARFLDLPGAHYALAQSARQIVAGNIDAFVRALPTITLPTLIIWGKDDPVINLSVAHRLSSDIAGSRLEVLPTCGHIPHEEFPKETARFISGFVSP